MTDISEIFCIFATEINKYSLLKLYNVSLRQI